MNEDDKSFPLHEASRDGKEFVVRSLLSQNPELVNVKDQDDRTALFWAISYNNPAIVTMLLNPTKVSISKPNTNSEEGNFKRSKSVAIDLEDPDAAGWTPLHVAVSIGNPVVISSLFEANPSLDVNVQTNAGQTPLFYAISKQRYDVAKDLIINHKASTRIKDKRWQLPLHRAAAIGSLPLLKLLLDEGKSPINSTDNTGYTALHHALAEGHGDIAIELVKRGADLEKKDNDGFTPIEVVTDEKVKKYFQFHLKEL